MDQYKNVDLNIIPKSNISMDKKNFSKTNFNFGNYNTLYKTVSNSDYSQRTPELNKFNINIKLNNNPNSRTHSYKMGDDMVDYLSDNKIRFYNPNFIKKIK